MFSHVCIAYVSLMVMVFSGDYGLACDVVYCSVYFTMPFFHRTLFLANMTEISDQ